MDFVFTHFRSTTRETPKGAFLYVGNLCEMDDLLRSLYMTMLYMIAYALIIDGFKVNILDSYDKWAGLLKFVRKFDSKKYKYLMYIYISGWLIGTVEAL